MIFKFCMRAIIVFCFGLILLWSCGKEPDCDLGIPRDNIAIKFYNSEDSTERIMKFLSVSERNSDQVFYTFADSASSYNLTLNPDLDQVTYVFVSSTSVDTLTLSYTSELQWLSEECGPSFYYDQLEVIGSSYTFDMVSTFIDVTIDENIKIYN